MFDLDEEMERMQKMLDRRERMALGVTCTEMIELITRLREAEKDAKRYRWLRDESNVSDFEFFESLEKDHWNYEIDELMKVKGDE